MSEQERKLTKDELKRKELFEAVISEYEDNGYTKREGVISELKVNIGALIIATPVAVVPAILYLIINRGKGFVSFNPLIVLLFYFGLIVVHELIHGIFFALFSKNGFKSVGFGFILEYLTPYCSCKEPLSKTKYIIALLMPTIVLGIIPAIVAALIGSPVWLIIGILLIYGGGGDMMIFAMLVSDRSDKKSKLVLDHAYKIGYVVLEK